MGYKLARKAVHDHVEKEDVLKRNTPTSSGEQVMLFINASGLYVLILSSKLPKAREFKHWVTSEVLPPPSVGRVDTWWPRGKPANMYHKSQITVSKRCRVEGWGVCQNAFFSFFRRG